LGKFLRRSENLVARVGGRIDLQRRPEQNERRFPPGHIFAGDSIDLAFVIVPEPSTVAVLLVGAVAVAIRRRCR